MFLKRRPAAFAAVIAALAVGAPVASASAATIPVTDPVITGVLGRVPGATVPLLPLRVGATLLPCRAGARRRPAARPPGSAGRALEACGGVTTPK
jgi:hypothetical protein